jgi:hypothetical protein
MSLDADRSYWGDFSYRFYTKLLEVCRERYAIVPLCEFLPPAEPAVPRVYLRHDIDICLEAAVVMAEQEAETGLRSTYMVIPTSPLYSVRSGGGRSLLQRIERLGHEIAIHFDIASSSIEGMDDLERIENAIAEQCDLLCDVTSKAVSSISFHRPIATFLHGPDYLFGKVNAYSATLMRFYHADSGGRWRHGNPIAAFSGPVRPLAQLLVHPIWWGKSHADPPQRLEEFFRRTSRSMTAAMTQDFDKRLGATLRVPRAGLLSASSGS